MWIFNKKRAITIVINAVQGASLSPFCSTELLSNYCPHAAIIQLERF